MSILAVAASTAPRVVLSLCLGTVTKGACGLGEQRGMAAVPLGPTGVAPRREGRRAPFTHQGGFGSCPLAEAKPCLAVVILDSMGCSSRPAAVGHPVHVYPTWGWGWP